MLLQIGLALSVVAGMVIAHSTAQGAADLAALAGAGALAHGGDACSAGRRVADTNGGRLDSCTIVGREVTVIVTVSGPRWLGQSIDLSARARAGPG